MRKKTLMVGSGEKKTPWREIKENSERWVTTVHATKIVERGIVFIVTNPACNLSLKVNQIKSFLKPWVPLVLVSIFQLPSSKEFFETS